MRSIEEYLLRHSQNNIIVRTTVATALYVLNHKRQNLADLEARFGLTISIEADDSVGAQHFAIDKGSIALGPIVPLTETPALGIADDFDETDPVFDDADEEAAESARLARLARTADNDDASRKRRRKRRRRGGRDRQESAGAEQSQHVRSDDDGDDADQPPLKAKMPLLPRHAKKKTSVAKSAGGVVAADARTSAPKMGTILAHRVTAKTVPDAEPVFVSIPLPDFAKPKTSKRLHDAAEAASVPVTAEELAAPKQPAVVEEAPAKKPAKRKSRSKAAIEAAEIAVAEVLAEAERQKHRSKPKRAPRKSAKKTEPVEASCRSKRPLAEVPAAP